MCQFKSCIILKDRVFVPDYDSHSDMLEELHIKDTFENASSLFIRAEISPADGNVFSDVMGWKFQVDQDILPDWYVPDMDETRAREAVAEWMKAHTLSGGNHEVKDGVWFACSNATVKAWNNATVKAWNNATVKAYDNATVKAWNNATVTACSNATVKAYDNATVKAWNNATVTACSNATVKAWNNATVKAWNNATVKAYDNATVKAWNNATVTACSNATVKAYDNATVKAWNNATVTACSNATVKAYDNATVTAYDNATVIIPQGSFNTLDRVAVTDCAVAIDHNTRTIKSNAKWTEME